MIKVKRSIPCLICLLFFIACNQKQVSPLDTAKRVADKVLQETVYEFERVPLEFVSGVEILDFRQAPDRLAMHYALSSVTVDAAQEALLGISRGGGLKIWLNDSLVYFNALDKTPVPKEIAYDFFVFQDTVQVNLKKGQNKILVKSVAGTKKAVVFLRLMKRTGEQLDVRYTSEPFAVRSGNATWITCGPLLFPSEYDMERVLKETLPPEQDFKDHFMYNGDIYNWYYPRQHLQLELKIPSTNSYKRESYLEWHYANGALMMALRQLGSVSGDAKYKEFVSRFCEFGITHFNDFKYQYEQMFAFRGAWHRLIRRIMLDDTGAPALPYLEMYAETGNPEYLRLVEPLADFIMHDQVRLADATLCRPEPVAGTIWADDLFMSVPFLLRITKITGDTRYMDDAVRQVVQFNKYLIDQTTGLFYHGWFNEQQKHTVALWGRANGWMIWAEAEALKWLPEGHPGYQEILKLFQDHLEALVRYQDKTGMWHQVLDHPESYEETSCTAMFVLAMARGVQHGWLKPEYAECAGKGWHAMIRNIDPDGTVHGICRGTGIGNDLQFYFDRQTFDHDPRGLGAVLTAGIEMSLMEKHLRGE